MNFRWPILLLPGVCLVAVLAFLAPEGDSGSPRAGSCSAPLAWRLADVDPRFGLAHEDALEAVRSAVGLWEGASGRTLFVEDASGFPIRFVFDERQARLTERMEGLALMQSRVEALGARGQDLQRRGDDIASRGERLEADARAFTDRQVAHNAAVERWNSGEGGAEDQRIALEEGAAALVQDRRTLIRRQREFQRLQEDFRDASADLEADVQRHNREAEALDRAFPGSLVESGRFMARVRDGVATSREIEIYRYQGPDDLVLVLAHELGHALGLGHTGAPDGVMREVATRRGDALDAPSISAADRELLGALCAEEG